MGCFGVNSTLCKWLIWPVWYLVGLTQNSTGGKCLENTWILVGLGGALG